MVFSRAFFAFIAFLFFTRLGAQPVVAINDTIDQYIFTFKNIEWLEDKTGLLTIEDVMRAEWSGKFKPSTTFSPTNQNRNLYYWFRINIQHNKKSEKQWVLEFFDQTIDYLEVYFTNPQKKILLGDHFPFDSRLVSHKNFVVDLPNDSDEIRTYFFRVKSQQRADVIVVLRSQKWLFQYALDEYFFFGIFYGMILVFSLYNLLMYLAVRETHYLLYMLYLASIGLFEMSADGIAYQYLWPQSPEWNTYAAGITLCSASCLSLLFTSYLLNLKSDRRDLFRLANAAIIVRISFFAVSLFFFPQWFTFKGIEIVPLGVAFYIGIRCLMVGFRYARFIVVGYSFLFFGIITKALLYFGIDWMPFGQLSHYSLGFSFIMEMLFLSFAITDKVRTLRREVHDAQEKTIEQLRENQSLKDSLNQKLEEQVELKTHELTQKSEFIEMQNRQLASANEQLERQAREIAEINAILEKDNTKLKHDVAEVKEARILSKNVDFDEFSTMYPDDESCLRFMANLKWGNGYMCKRCGNDNYSVGRSLHSRRCSKCGYDESVIAYTILQNSRLPINKSLYMIFLIYSSNGSISSHKLSEALKIRQATCWAYSLKIKNMMKRHKRLDENSAISGWNSLLFEPD